MAIKEMDCLELAEQFKKMCASGHVDGDIIYRFLMYVVPLYEASKKQLVSEALTQGVKELTDWLWEDPMNPTPYSQIRVLKEIAKELNITIQDATRTSE